MRRRLPVLFVVALGAALFAAPAGAGDAKDQEIADDVIAQVGDLVPAGWEEDPDRGEDDAQADVPACEDIIAIVDDAKDGPFAEIAYQDTADQTGFTDVGVSVYIFSKAKQAKRFSRALTSKAAFSCANSVTAQLGGGSVAPIDFNSASGFEITAQSNGFTYVIDQLQTREGRAVAFISGLSANEPLPFLEDLIVGVEEALSDAL